MFFFRVLCAVCYEREGAGRGSQFVEYASGEGVAVMPDCRLPSDFLSALRRPFCTELKHKDNNNIFTTHITKRMSACRCVYVCMYVCVCMCLWLNATSVWLTSYLFYCAESMFLICFALKFIHKQMLQIFLYTYVSVCACGYDGQNGRQRVSSSRSQCQTQ